MEHQQLRQILKQTTIGKALSSQEIDRLAQMGKLASVSPQSILLTEGQTSEAMLVILAGQVEILKGPLTDHPQRIAVYESGAVLGEIGLLLEIPRTASVRTLSPCQVFWFPRTAFNHLLDAGDRISSKIAVELAQGLGAKLQFLTEEVVELFKEHDALLETIENLRHSSAQLEAESLRNKLLEQAAQLRKSQRRVQKQMNYLNTQMQQTQLVRRGAELAIAVAVSIVATLLLVNGVGLWRGIQARWGASPDVIETPAAGSSESHPAIIPYIKTAKDCARRYGSVWRDDKCYDYVHDPEW